MILALGAPTLYNGKSLQRAVDLPWGLARTPRRRGAAPLRSLSSGSPRHRPGACTHATRGKTCTRRGGNEPIYDPASREYS